MHEDGTQRLKMNRVGHSCFQRFLSERYLKKHKENLCSKKDSVNNPEPEVGDSYLLIVTLQDWIHDDSMSDVASDRHQQEQGTECHLDAVRWNRGKMIRRTENRLDEYVPCNTCGHPGQE
jgi:hypothetical protein